MISGYEYNILGSGTVSSGTVFGRGFIRFDHISRYEFFISTPACYIYLVGGSRLELYSDIAIEFIKQYIEWRSSRASRFETLENAAVQLAEAAYSCK